MEYKKISAIFAAFLLFAATAAAATGKSDETRSDLWLKAKIVTAYTLNSHLNPFKLDVDVKDGVAHLSGTVDSDVERDLAVEIAKGVEGVKDVKEDIKLDPGAMAGERKESKFFRSVEDATITARVKSKLLWNRNTDGLNINVTTEKGVVTLKGKVASGAQGELAARLAENTPGVEGVRKELKVAPEAETAAKQMTPATAKSNASDAWITTKVDSMLLFSKEAEGAKIDVSTRNQVVTLEGTVGSESQKEKILKLVGDISGVKEVRSKLTVQKG